MDSGDEVLAVTAANRVGLVANGRWPVVAAHLLVLGHDGEHLTQLAGLSAPASGWDVDQLIPQVLREIGAPTLAVEEAGDVVARLFVLAPRGDAHGVIRALAALAPTLDYPGGLIDRAYQADEWLDCDCHGPATAEQLQIEIAAMPRLRVPEPLLETLTSH